MPEFSIEYDRGHTMEQANLPELPEEMIMLILCWLPVKSLIRFTCVSKPFRSMIQSGPNFAKSQLQAARDRKTLTRKLLYTVKGYPNSRSIDLETLSSVRSLNLPSQSATYNVRSLLGSCNGIVFLAVDDQVFYMVNPSTGLSKKLPDHGLEFDNLDFYGVGYLPATDDYRVFLAYSIIYGDEDDIYKAAVFSSRANAWETFEYDELDVVPFVGTLLKETLHWLVYFEPVILAFDLTQKEDHKFRKMLLPKFFNDHRPPISVGDIKLSAGECLLLVHFLKDAAQCIHVWVMREYDVPDSWTKLFNLKFSGPPKEQWRYSCGDVFVMETSTVFTIVVVGDKNDYCVLTKILHEGDECSFYKVEGLRESVIYQESLLPIDD